jgi:uncharacterized phage protein (TIGR02218 family)
MRTIPTELQAKLDTGATTLCRCWVLTRGDGTVLGFTDHDDDVSVAGVTCRAGTGLTASEATQQFGLAVGGSELAGALTSDTLNEDDLAAGRYDAADVKLYLVDWSEPPLNILLAAGTIGEVRRQGLAFTAEMRGLAQRLAEQSGSLFTASCSADLGDQRCTIDLTNPLYRGNGAIVGVTSAVSFVASGLGAFADGWFTAGRVAWSTGANAGLAMEVKTHRVSAAGVQITLWQTMAEPLAEGDTFVVTAGCDKSFATCRDRFANGVNFRGFPQIPGNDFVIQYAVPGQAGNDGTSFVEVD